MNLIEDGKGICECFQSELIKWEKLKLHSNLFLWEGLKFFISILFNFLLSTVCWKQKLKHLVWGKLSENSACHSGIFLEADYNVAALRLFRCPFNTIRSKKALEVLVGLQGVLDSDGAWSFQGLDQPLKFLPWTQASEVCTWGIRLQYFHWRAFSVLRLAVCTAWSVGR